MRALIQAQTVRHIKLTVNINIKRNEIEINNENNLESLIVDSIKLKANEIIFGGKDPRTAVLELMTRKGKEEYIVEEK